VDVDPAGPPAAYDAFSPLFRFTPDGLTFAAPVTVTFAASANVPAATVYWSSADGYSPLPTTWSGATASAIVHHFSGGFVGLLPDDGGAGSDGGADATVGADATPGADAAVDATAPIPLGGPGDPCDNGCQADLVCADAVCTSVTQSTLPGDYCDNETAFCEGGCGGPYGLVCLLNVNQCACACSCGATPCSSCPAQTLPAGAACTANALDPSTGLWNSTCIIGLTCVSGTCQVAPGVDAAVDATPGADAAVDATAPIPLGGPGDPCDNGCQVDLVCADAVCTSVTQSESAGDYCDNETAFCASGGCGGARYALVCALNLNQCACACTCGNTPCSSCPAQTLPAGAACTDQYSPDPSTGLFDPTCIIGLTCVSGTCQ
jgi:hypothetical protein